MPWVLMAYTRVQHSGSSSIFIGVFALFTRLRLPQRKMATNIPFNNSSVYGMCILSGFESPLPSTTTTGETDRSDYLPNMIFIVECNSTCSINSKALARACSYNSSNNSTSTVLYVSCRNCTRGRTGGRRAQNSEGPSYKNILHIIACTAPSNNKNATLGAASASIDSNRLSLFFVLV